jgi:hypothetical protein
VLAGWTRARSAAAGREAKFGGESEMANVDTRHSKTTQQASKHQNTDAESGERYASPTTVFILGTLSMFGFTFLMGIPAILAGMRTGTAMKEGKISDNNKALVDAGVLLGWVGTVLGGIIALIVMIYLSNPEHNHAPLP